MINLRGEHTLPTTAHLGLGTLAVSTPLITKPEASFSVSNRSPILADKLAANSSDPPLPGDFDGVLDCPPPLGPEREGVAIFTPQPLRPPPGGRRTPKPTAGEALAVEIFPAAGKTTTLKRKTLA
jgi:hypothetical protein